jgi:hypothetical protein
MSSQIRITKTPELEKAIMILKSKWTLMDEIEIVKMAINLMLQQQSQEFANSLSADEIFGITQSQNDIKNGNYTVLRSEEEIAKHFNNL